MVDVTVIGAGYVGLCTGVVLAELGHRVRLVDIDEAKVQAVRGGRSPFHEPGLDEALKQQVATGQLTAGADTAQAVQASALTLLCVGTPQGQHGQADLSYIQQAARDVGTALGDGDVGAYHVVATKSTVPPGTAREVVTPAVAEASGRAPGQGLDACSLPEFLREGNALQDAREPDRVVVGAPNQRAADVLWQLYEDVNCPKLTVSPTAAEMIKYAANAMLAARVGLSNELANVCQAVGVDWTEVAEGIGLDHRIGPHFLRAGAGFGGSCFPKDVAAIAHVARQQGAPSGILEAVLEGNQTQPLRLVEMLRAEIGELDGKRIALLGLAFKPDTDDVRETRALPIHHALTEAGAQVVCHDPAAGDTFGALVPEATVVETVDEALDGAHGCIVQTAWPAYGQLAPEVFTQRMEQAVVIDGRRTFEAEAIAELEEGGVRYRAIGFGRSDGPRT